MVATVLMSAMLFQAKTQEIEFQGATDLKLAGELMLPEGDGPFPTVLMMPGSGPTDRDGNQPGLTTDVLKQIAEHLAKNGIATFRFDKRPVMRYRNQWPKTTDLSVFSEYFSLANHVADVEAAYKTMLKQPKVDAKRTALLGHSEGGLFASWEAPLLKPTALLLLGTAGNTMESVIRFQVGESVRKATAPQELKDAIIASNEETMKSLIEKGKLPEKVHPNLAALYNGSTVSLMRSYLTVDPIVPLKKFTGPVLVLNGENDVQIRATVDAKRLFEAASSRKDTTQELAIIDGASHNLKTVKEGDAMSAFVGPVVPQALEKITAFLKKHLK